MADENNRAEFERAFQKLKQAYIRRIANTIRIIDNMKELEKLNTPRRDDLVRAQALVHGLAGSGTTFGFPELTDVGHYADHFFEVLLKNFSADDEISAGDLKQMHEWMNKTRQICAAISHQAARDNPDLANSNIYVKPGTAGHGHVLIVEDDLEVAGAIAHALQAEGATAQIAVSGEDALHYLSRVSPDFTLIDKELAGIDGMEVLQRIKQNSEFLDIPVMMMATRHNHEDEAYAKQAGALDYIPKPIEVYSLAKRICGFLKREESKSQSI